jgi:hypothetical protein
MKEQLAESYQKSLTRLFRDTKNHLNSKQYGAEKSIIAATIPLMILQNWSENDRLEEIPLLGECVDNVILAIASAILGWRKTAYLHLRVSLECIFYGAHLLMNNPNHTRFQKNGSIPYKKFTDLLAEFQNYSISTKRINREFRVNPELKKLYTSLSEWSHTLGNEFILNLSALGRNGLSGKQVGDMREHLKILSKYASIVYLCLKPSLIGELSGPDQRHLLQNLSITERKKLREILCI